jgi:hypothetical protein
MRIKQKVKGSTCGIMPGNQPPHSYRSFLMTTIPQLSQAMQEVLTSAAERADAEVHFTRRADLAKFSASTLTQTLVLGYLAHPDATPEQLAQTAAAVAVDVTPQAIEARMNLRTASLLAAVLRASVRQLIASDDPVAIPILQRFSGLFVHDSTTIALPDALAAQWPGCAGDGPVAALKCGVQIDLLSGALTAMDLAAGRAADPRLPCQHARLPIGSLRLADLGFFDLAVLHDLDASGAYFLSKLRASSLISDASGQDVQLLAFVQHLGALPRWDGWVRVGSGGVVRARLLLERVPKEVADQRRRRVRKEARDKGRKPSAAALALAEWTIMITNAPSALLSLEEALVLARVRWQIELLFKLWKSHGQLERSRSGNALHILCEVYAKLLAMLLQHWVMVVSCWRYPDRSLVKAAQVLRDHATALATAKGQREIISAVLETIACILRRTARMNRRHAHPNTYQLLLALTTVEDEQERVASVLDTVPTTLPARTTAQPVWRCAA